MEASEFWAEVNAQQVAILSALEKEPGAHPINDGAVYIVSRRNREKNSVAGSVCLAAVRLAAQRIAENTHQLATAGNIKQFLQERAEDQERTEAIEVNRRAQFVVQVGNEARLPKSGRGSAPTK